MIAVVFFDIEANGTPVGRIEMTVRSTQTAGQRAGPSALGWAAAGACF